MGNKNNKVCRVSKRKFGGNQFTRRDAEKLQEYSSAKKWTPTGKVEVDMMDKNFFFLINFKILAISMAIRCNESDLLE